MIRALGTPVAPVDRLLAACERLDAGATTRTLVVGPPHDAGTGVDALGREVQREAPDRVLALLFTGTHPDARAELLRRSWDLEEAARGLGRPLLVLRLAPIVGPESPLARRLATRPALPKHGRTVVCPVAETDVQETLARAFAGTVAWEDWWEVAGAEPWSLAELAALASRSSPRTGADAGAWEPPLDVLLAQRLCDPEPWSTRFGIAPASIASVLGGVAA